MKEHQFPSISIIQREISSSFTSGLVTWNNLHGEAAPLSLRLAASNVCKYTLEQLDTAARTYVRWTGFHSSLLGFHTPEVNTGGVEATRTRASEHQRDKHGDSHEMRRMVVFNRSETKCCCSTLKLHRPAASEGLVL